MNIQSDVQNIESYIPVAGGANVKSPVAHQITRGLVRVANTLQMAVAESYINGLEVPDSPLRALCDAYAHTTLKYFPSLLVPYEWVLRETDNLAEGSKDLMRVQYDLPQQMLNRMLGDGKLVYPKYSVGLWEKGAVNLEQSQMHMIDDMIVKLNIQDGDNILDFGCGWGCVPNYIMSRFPNVRFTGLNLSHEQCEYMRRKMQDPESHLSSGRFTLIEGDLNDIEFEEKFDKVLSVGVFCHVGNLTKSFEKLAACLKPGGVFFLHIITVRLPNNISSAFTHKYIFPHGRYWNFDAVPSHNRDLKTVKRWYLNGMNYFTTGVTWLKNFDGSYEYVRGLDYGMDFAKFRRIWRFYLIFLSSMFSSCDGEINGNGQFLMIHA